VISMGLCVGKCHEEMTRKGAELEERLENARHSLRNMNHDVTKRQPMPRQLRNDIRRWRKGERPRRGGMTWVDEETLHYIEASFCSEPSQQHILLRRSKTHTSWPLYDVLLVHVLQMLDVHELAVCRFVCKAWSRACTNSTVWRTLHPVVMYQDLEPGLADAHLNLDTLGWALAHTHKLDISLAHKCSKDFGYDEIPSESVRLLIQSHRLAHIRELRVMQPAPWLCNQLQARDLASLTTFTWLATSSYSINQSTYPLCDMVSKVVSLLPAATLTRLDVPALVLPGLYSIAPLVQRLCALEHLSFRWCGDADAYWDKPQLLQCLPRLTTLDMGFIIEYDADSEVANLIKLFAYHPPLTRLVLHQEVLYCSSCTPLHSVSRLACALDSLASTIDRSLSVRIIPTQHAPRYGNMCECASVDIWRAQLGNACSSRARDMLQIG
jgi:hypothetical protein